MKHTKQKVYILLSYKDAVNIVEGVYATKKAGERALIRKENVQSPYGPRESLKDQSDIKTYHLIKKSVQGTEIFDAGTRYDISWIFTGHGGSGKLKKH